MTPADTLVSHAEYVREIRPLLSSDVYRARPSQLISMFMHLCVLPAGALIIRHGLPSYLLPLVSLIIGHSMACIAFASHDLAHSTIIRSPLLRYPLEVLFWGTVGMPATVFYRLHVQGHHKETNTIDDPDRKFALHQKTPLVDAYNYLFYAHKRTLRWNPLIGWLFVTYGLRNTVAAFYPKGSKPDIVPAQMSFNSRLRLRIVFELAVIVLLQWGMFALAGHQWSHYLWASIIPLYIASAVAILYIYTEHSTLPLFERTDPVLGSVSVIVPKFFDSLYNHVSYHTEHHLFPSVNPHYYPQVAEILKTRYPERYNRKRIWDVWREIWQSEMYVSFK